MKFQFKRWYLDVEVNILLSRLILILISGSAVRNEENENLFQGDIMLTNNQRQNLFNFGVKQHSAVEGGIWNHGIIPYEINANYTTKDRNKILRAMDTFHKNTCIRFIPRRPNEKYYINLRPDVNQCSSFVGKVTSEEYIVPGGQWISLGKGCMRHGT